MDATTTTESNAVAEFDNLLSVLPRLLFLGALYFVQGLPFGFQASALALPWMLKALWAPLVDRSRRQTSSESMAVASEEAGPSG